MREGKPKKLGDLKVGDKFVLNSTLINGDEIDEDFEVVGRDGVVVEFKHIGHSAVISRFEAVKVHRLFSYSEAFLHCQDRIG